MAQRTAICLECGIEFQASSRGRVAERCEVHRKQRHRKMSELAQLQRKPCKHPGGCLRRSHWNGWCGMHAHRIRQHGDPGPVGEKEARTEYNNGGYRMIRMDAGKLVYEHRLLMEQVLGRPLEPFEEVHHKNGIRHDNSPDNLELWTKSQPSGQRPEDLVSWVVQYYPDLVAAELRARQREQRTGQLRIVP